MCLCTWWVHLQSFRTQCISFSFKFIRNWWSLNNCNLKCKDISQIGESQKEDIHQQQFYERNYNTTQQFDVWNKQSLGMRVQIFLLRLTKTRTLLTPHEVIVLGQRNSMILIGSGMQSSNSFRTVQPTHSKANKNKSHWFVRKKQSLKIRVFDWCKPRFM